MQNSNKNLFLLDAYALIYRGYYALIKNPRVNSKGMNTSAILGFVNTLEEVLKKENPQFIAIGFDRSGLQMDGFCTWCVDVDIAGVGCVADSYIVS